MLPLSLCRRVPLPLSFLPLPLSFLPLPLSFLPLPRQFVHYELPLAVRRLLGRRLLSQLSRTLASAIRSSFAEPVAWEAASSYADCNSSSLVGGRSLGSAAPDDPNE